MQIIQSIREKGAAIVIAVIALSLIGFILMDAQQGGSRLFSSFSTDIGKVNGESIELADFNRRVKESEDMQAQRSGQRPQTYQMRENMWNQVIAEKVFFAEADKLGIRFTSKELSHILLSNDPTNPLFQEQGMKDSLDNTKLDLKKAQEALSNIKKSKGEQRDLVNAQIIDPLKLNTAVAKYTGLINASAYYPTWLKEKETADNNNFATISYVTIPYSEIPDSTVKVTDQDINDYVKKNKELFKQEAGRNISYLSFSEKANVEDSAATAEAVAQLKQAFQADTNAKAFVARSMSSIEFKDDYAPKSSISPLIADTLVNLPVGTVYGPYTDKNSYVLAKVIGTKVLPDSVKARHILINEKDPQTSQTELSDSAAKSRADSIYNAILAGSDFATLAKMYSTDGSNKDKGGDLGFFGYGAMVPEFNDFCFNKPVGTKGVVKTQFGYHIVEILNQKDLKTAYKVAYVGKEIDASAETINKVSLAATKASAEKTRANLEKYIAKNNLNLIPVPNLIKENDYSVGPLQDARSLVRWAFEAKKGDVSEPFNIGDQFIVAVLDKINEKGVQDAATARLGCESTIRNKKKAEIIIKKLGNNPTLEAAAAAYNKQVLTAGTDSTITFSSQMINGVGMENKIIGAAFNKTFQGKTSPAIEGTTGVFVIKVNGIQPKEVETPEAMAQRISNRKNALRSQLNNWFEGLRKQADIKDNRSKHF